jgi:hypothetical protein
VFVVVSPTGEMRVFEEGKRPSRALARALAAAGPGDVVARILNGTTRTLWREPPREVDEPRGRAAGSDALR